MTGDKRRRRDQRQADPPGLALQPRDLDIVEAVYQFRVLTQTQIQHLFFGLKNKSGSQRRLVKLYDHGFLERQFFPVRMGQGRSPTMYVLDRKGADLLRSQRGYEDLSWYSSSLDLSTDFMEHTLAINDVMVAVTLSCRDLGYTLEVWHSESQVKSDYDRVPISTGRGRRADVAIVPDSYFAIVANQRRHHFFLELDRGTMTHQRFERKVKAYLVYHRTGGYEKRYETKSLRVLTVTTGETRLANLKATTEGTEGKRRFWFTTLDQVNYQAVLTEPIWQVATQKQKKALIEPSEKE